MRQEACCYEAFIKLYSALTSLNRNLILPATRIYEADCLMLGIVPKTIPRRDLTNPSLIVSAAETYEADRLLLQSLHEAVLCPNLT